VTALDVAIARLRVLVLRAREDIARAASPLESAACMGRVLGLERALAETEALACRDMRSAAEAVS
jgi:hypothetical protein